MELGLNKIRFTLLPLHQHSKRDGTRRPFRYAARQRTGANFARKPPLMRVASLFTFPYIRAFHYAPCAQVRRLADAHPKGTLTLSQDAFAALRPAERECTPRRKRTLLLTPSAHCGECLVVSTSIATNRRELRAQTTIDACRIPFYFSVYPSVSLCPMRASSAACRRSPKRNTHPFARRFRRPASHRTGMYASSERRRGNLRGFRGI